MAAEISALSAASTELRAATYALPKDQVRIAAASTALAKAREAWATKASALFAELQASTNKLSEAAIAQLIASAPGGGGRGRGAGGLRAAGPARR